MRVANGVEMLEIFSNMMGRQNTVYPVLLYDDNTAALVDTGYPGQIELFREAVDKAGVPFGRINKIIITHHDIDHIGSLSTIAGELDEAEVIAYAEEKQYITGEKTPLKLAQLEARRDNLTEDMGAFYERLKSGFAHCRADVDKTVEDGDVLPYLGGIKIIYTPGHTLGHMSLYHIQSRTLISGDALNIDNGRLTGPNPKYTYDMDAAFKSVERFVNYDIENIICYHGGLYNDDANQSILHLLKRA